MDLDFLFCAGNSPFHALSSLRSVCARINVSPNAVRHITGVEEMAGRQVRVMLPVCLTAHFAFFLADGSGLVQSTPWPSRMRTP
jgi:hypothetical protein